MDIKMARKKSTPDNNLPTIIKFDAIKNAKLHTQNGAQLAEFAAESLIAAEVLGIQKTSMKHFRLSPVQRGVLLSVSGIGRAIQAKLKKEAVSFTVAEVASLTMVLAKAFTDDDPYRQIALLLIAEYLFEGLQKGIEEIAELEIQKEKERNSKADRKVLYQFKITLL
jgi:hypothetical protein